MQVIKGLKLRITEQSDRKRMLQATSMPISRRRSQKQLEARLLLTDTRI